MHTVLLSQLHISFLIAHTNITNVNAPGIYSLRSKIYFTFILFHVSWPQQNILTVVKPGMESEKCEDNFGTEGVGVKSYSELTSLRWITQSDNVFKHLIPSGYRTLCISVNSNWDIFFNVMRLLITVRNKKKCTLFICAQKLNMLRQVYIWVQYKNKNNIIGTLGWTYTF